jgi:hypothetical protein
VQGLLVFWEGTDAICRQSNRVHALSYAFKVFKKVEEYAACEMRSVIHFLNARNMKPADIHRQHCEVYEEHAMSDSMVRRWVRHFNERLENVRDDPRSADRLWIMKIWCVEWKRRLKRTDDSPFRHFPCIFHKFQGHFFTKLFLKNFIFGNCVHEGVYCDTFEKLLRAIQNKRRGMLSRDAVMLHDNARPHTLSPQREMSLRQFDHRFYSPDSAPSDFHVFLHLKTFLGGRRFHDDNEVKEAVNTWFASRAV